MMGNLPRRYGYAVLMQRLAAIVRMPLLGFATLVFPPVARTQGPLSEPTPAAITALVTDAVRLQEQDLHRQHWAVRYRVHRIDGKQDTLRDLVETDSGNVARTLQRNGHALSPDEQAAEVQRLQAIAAKGELHHGVDPFERYGDDLIRAMPTAMDYTPVPAQPQLPQFPMQQTVLDFNPRGGFHPASTAQSMLKGLSGRIWLDSQTHHLLRIEVNIQQDLDLAFGILARVYKGGRIVYEQVPVDPEHDVYRLIQVDVRLRELMIKTTPYHLLLETTERTPLSAVPSLQEGVALLLGK